MNHLRPASFLLAGGLFVSLIAPSCATVGDDDTAGECPRGAKGCRCKTGDTCNSGLTCNDSGKCAAATGQGGSATGGTAGQANGGRAGTEAFARAGTRGHGTGGTTADAGAGGEPGPGAGGVPSRGTGGTGNAPGQAGDGAYAGEAGEAGSGGTSGPGTGGTGGSNVGGAGGTAGMGGSPACTPISLTTLTVTGDYVPDAVIYSSIFTPNVGDGLVDDGVVLQIYETLDGVDYSGADLGTFQLGTGEDANFSSCSRCVVAVVDESKWFFATAGTLTFASDSDQMNLAPHGTLRNVVLREGTYDEDTYVSTLVPGGDCLTLADGDLLVNSEPPPPPPPPPEGWTCVADFYNDTFCDCGCGAHDADCATSAGSVCEYCYCNPSDDMDCSAVDATQNEICNL